MNGIAKIYAKAAMWLCSQRRYRIAKRYVSGSGIEIGALHCPLRLPNDVAVQYVDRETVPELRARYPELNGLDLAPVDLVDDGETLAKIGEGSQDFIVACHFLEHCKNPIQVLGTFYRTLVPGGVLYLVIPDKSHTFDRTRELTTFDHLLNDFTGNDNHFDHFVDFVKSTDESAASEQSVIERANHLAATGYSVHFHVWNFETFRNFLSSTIQHLQLDLSILQISKNFSEVIAVLRKGKIPANPPPSRSSVDDSGTGAGGGS